MFAVREIAAAGDGTPRSLELVDEASDARARIDPDRGALAYEWSVRGRQIFFLDPATLRDSKKNVRGGNPVLFPTPGKLANDSWSRDGKSGTLKQHGFARDLAWREIARSTDDAAAVTLALASSEATRAGYPWDFRATLGFSLAGDALALEARVENIGDSTMPFAFGFHPYFAVTDKATAKIPTSATLAFDNVSKRDVSFDGFDLAGGEVDMHLLDHRWHGRRDRATLELGPHDGGGELALEGSEEFTHWVVWTLPGRDFVCLEPWTAPGNAMTSGDRLIELAPGAARVLRMTYRFRSRSSRAG